jgi:hypothetical protein
MNHNIDKELSTASDFEFPCKPLLGPFPELMQPQPSLRVVQGSIVWHQHIRGACWRWKRGGAWGGEAFLRPFLHWQCQLGTVPYTILYFTIFTVEHSATITVVSRKPYYNKYGPCTLHTVIAPYCTTQQAWAVPF